MYLKLVLVVIITVLNLNKVFAQYEDIPTTKSYDLQVPGSDPIRIIEAEPLWDRNSHEMFVTTTEKPWSEVEHRALRPVIKTTPFQTKTSLNRPNFQSEENETEDTTPDSTEELTKFLKGYAEHLRRTTKPPVTEESDYDSSERFHKVELITKPSEEPINRLANLYLGDPGETGLEVEDKSKDWNLMNMRKHKHPFDDKNGWVSLELVPWSVSKVAKWHSSILKPSDTEENPWQDKYSEDKQHWQNKYTENKPWQNKHPDHTTSGSIATWIYHPNKPVASYNPPAPSHNTKPFNYGSPNVENRPDPRPTFSVPSTTYGQKVYLQQDYTDEIPKPSWHKKTQNSYYNPRDQKDENCEHGPPGIITDGLPPNFPKPQQNNRRKGSMGEEEHSPSHPFNGDGEWILLTTTKGYKASNGRQRSLDIEAAPEHDPDSISTHKSVRLTVLPPLKDSKINMTTSHGGLLQVESTFETVEDAQKTALKKQNLKRRPLKRRPLKKPAKQIIGQVLPTSNTVVGSVKPTNNSKKKQQLSNPNSVLAAVGAGMIPATMAMLVPMAMGRRRRRDLIFSTRSPDVIGFKIQLPQSL